MLLGVHGAVGVQHLAQHEDVVLVVQRIDDDLDGLELAVTEVTLGLARARTVEAPVGEVLQLLDRPVDDLRLRPQLGGGFLTIDPDVLGADFLHTRTLANDRRVDRPSARLVEAYGNNA